MAPSGETFHLQVANPLVVCFETWEQVVSIVSLEEPKSTQQTSHLWPSQHVSHKGKAEI